MTSRPSLVGFRRTDPHVSARRSDTARKETSDESISDSPAALAWSALRATSPDVSSNSGAGSNTEWKADVAAVASTGLQTERIEARPGPAPFDDRSVVAARRLADTLTASVLSNFAVNRVGGT